VIAAIGLLVTTIGLLLVDGVCKVGVSSSLQERCAHRFNMISVAPVFDESDRLHPRASRGLLPRLCES
jgi:hypothetical protein